MPTRVTTSSEFIPTPNQYVQLDLNYGNTINVVITDNNYIYVAGYSGLVKKYNKIDYSLVATSPNYGNTIYTIEQDNDYIYVGGLYTIGNVTEIRKYNKSDLSLSLTSSSAYNYSVKKILIDGDYLYIAGGDNTLTSTDTEVWVLNKTNLSLIHNPYKASGGAVIDMVQDAAYIYISVGTSTSNYIKKLSKSDILANTYSELAITANFGTSYVDRLAIDNDNLYSGNRVSTIIKHSLSNLSTISSIKPYATALSGLSIDDTYVYLSNTAGAKRVLKSTLSSEINLVIPNGYLVFLDNYVYISYVVKIMRKYNKDFTAVKSYWGYYGN